MRYFLPLIVGLLAALTASPTGPRPASETVLSPPAFDSLLTHRLIYIEGGSFRRGSSEGDEDEKPARRITVRDFWMANKEVSFDEYDRFCAETGHARPSDAGWGRGDRPVIHVNWHDAMAYCAWLSQKTGRRVRLPAEAEWEYAAGGGGVNRTYWAGTDRSDHLDAYAWYATTSGMQTQPTGLLQPNRLGLYDMTGNVWEWCQDWYGYRYYAEAPHHDPQGPRTGTHRVLRGGSWSSGSIVARVTFRFRWEPGLRDPNAGFRIVCEP